MIKVTISDPVLYAVYVGEMIGQFSDGYWENSRTHRYDWKYFGYDNAFLVEKEKITRLPIISYSILNFFRFVKRENLKDIIVRVLMLYRNGEKVKEAYMNGDARALISALSHVDYADRLKEWGHFERQLEAISKYFGTLENFKSMKPVINKESIKEFMKIGKELHNSFEHVRSIF